jgi:hypothetical protein
MKIQGGHSVSSTSDRAARSFVNLFARSFVVGCRMFSLGQDASLGAQKSIKLAAAHEAVSEGGKAMFSADKGTVPTTVQAQLSGDLRREGSSGFRGGGVTTALRPYHMSARSVLSTLKEHPTTWVVPLLLFGLMLGLGVFGVVYGAQKEVQQSR